MRALPAIACIDLDPVGGVAGDMVVAALLDAFPEESARVDADLAAAGVPDGVTLAIEAGQSAGFRCARLAVAQATDRQPPRTLGAMTAFLAGGRLAQPVAERATAIFRLLAEAEAHVHGVDVDAVHFHEVADWDSVVDIVAAASLITTLDRARWRIGPLPLGGGMVRTAHGQIPVPAPATLRLLQGFDWIDDGISGERVTPTGAAILRHLDPARRAGSGAAPLSGRLERIGIGGGTRQLQGRPNILRVMAFSAVAATGDEDFVERLAFEVDDMTGEELALALDRLRALPGVVDAMQVPMIGKKGRAAVGLRLIVSPGATDTAVAACFAETSTLGIRRESLRRHVLPRSAAEARLGDRTIAAKRATRPGGTRTAKAESDALAAVPTLAARRALADAAARQVLEEGRDD